METNEELKGRLVQEAEREIVRLLKRVEEWKEGGLKGVEQEVFTGRFTLGRTVLERLV